MVDTPTTTNAAATTADAITHAAICDVAAKLVEAAIIAAVPVLDNPITVELTDLAVGFVCSKIYEVLAQMETKGIIDLQVGNEVGDANAAATALKQAQAGGNASAISQAQQNFSNAFGNLIHYGGSASP